MKFLVVVFLLAVAMASPIAAQTWDTSGNQLLVGTFYFRQVLWLVGFNDGSLGAAIALYGTIGFDGQGNYSMSFQDVDSRAAFVQTFNATGTYSISASGYGFISSPFSDGGSVYGLVSNGVFIGSSTEAGFNDLFIAAQLPSSLPTNSFFRGSYSMVGVDFPDLTPATTLDYQFQVNPDGNGNIGNVSATGYVSAAGSTVVTQNIGGVRYSFSGGSASVNFGSSSTARLIVGNKSLYFSPDGNFVFGGSPTAWDMIIGVRNTSGATNFSGLYYQAGATQVEPTTATGFADLDTFYGSLKANAGVILGAQRFLSVFNNNPLDFTYASSFTLNADGTADDSNNHYFFGNGGALRVGMSKFPSIGVNVAIQAPTFTPSGVFIDPTGILNAGSSALFTTGVAPGELISIYGSNLAPALKVDGTFPTTLGGVQVMVNNRPAPIYVVSPGQISAVVPFATNELIASIQVINNGNPSNTVTSFVNLTAPGVFTNPVGGLGSAAALHPDFKLVTADNPAQVGETIAIYLTGLGAVSPAVADGAPGPSNPLSNATNAIFVLIDGQQATPAFAGLAPGLVGLYQINVQVPTGVHMGNVNLAISAPDYFTSEATIPIGSSGLAASESTDRIVRPVVERKKLGTGSAVQRRRMPN
ncbi:MAG TPA: IPT/TIG domain-containing protein [Bryobacteraceae bacterium]|nr:IPT/TIG domain-containing protein [Bryobacteraceae bacterium]